LNGRKGCFKYFKKYEGANRTRVGRRKKVSKKNQAFPTGKTPSRIGMENYIWQKLPAPPSLMGKD